MKSFYFLTSLVFGQFSLFDDNGSLLVDGNQYDDFGFFANFGPPAENTGYLLAYHSELFITRKSGHLNFAIFVKRRRKSGGNDQFLVF